MSGPTVQAGSIHGDVHFHQSRPDTGQPPVPRQLPAPPANFVGREPELAALDRALADLDRRRGLVLVTGVGGVGKSALVLCWAQQVSERFVHGQLYANLGAFSADGPVGPGEVLSQFLRALGTPPERVPAAPAEQAASFRTLTADMALLVLLDNAISAAQVRQLLPTSARCLVVVTARWRLSGLLGEGARLIALGPLDERAAVSLLDQTLGSERVTADKAATSSLVQLCAGLPIALSVTAARLAARPRWSINRVVTELAHQHRRLASLSTQEDLSVRATFDLSYQHLPAPAARCYRVLGLHPGPQFGTEVVAAALALPVDQAADLLDVLIEANLLDELGDHRYRMHDLVRLHAWQQAETDGDQAVVQRRVVEWYLAGTRAADLVLTPYRPRPPTALRHLPADTVVLVDRDQALDWLERERTNLVATIRYAADSLPELAWQLADAMWPLFNYRRHHADRMEVDRIAVDCARRLGNRSYQESMTRRWGLAHFDLDQFDEATDLLRQSLALAEELGDQRAQAAALSGLGQVALAQQDMNAAAGYFTRELALIQATGERRGSGLALLNLGQVAARSAQTAQAITYLTQADAIFAELGNTDPYNAARITIELGKVLGQAGQPRQAAHHLHQALAAMTRVGSPRGQAQALHALGQLALSTGDRAGAAGQLTEALRIYERLGDSEAAEVRLLIGSIPVAGTEPDPPP